MAWFEDVTEAHGLTDISHVARNALDGTAIAVHDMDRDGLADLVFAPGLQPIEVAWGAPDGRFLREDRGLPSHAARALTAADLDGDGRVELVTADLGLRVFRYDNGFAEVTAALALDLVTLSEPVDILPVDLDRDGRLDLHISEWGPANQTLIQTVDGRFQSADILGSEPEESWTATLADLDEDGVAELFVATDTRQIDYGAGEAYQPGTPHDHLYADDAGVWNDQAVERGLDGQRSTMGGLATDLEGDGRVDLWLPNLGRSHALVADSTGFQHREDALGLAVASRRDVSECTQGGDLRSCLLVSWASLHEDLDGDGLLDLFVVNGGLEEDWRGPQPGQLFLGQESGFAEVPVTAIPGRSLAPLDLDADGDLDLVIGTHNDGVVAWQTSMPSPESWTLHLASSLSPSEGRGARLVARWGTRQRTLFVGSGGVAMTSRAPWVTVHGPPPDELEVHWPSGLIQRVDGQAELLVQEPEVLTLSASELPADGVSIVIVEVRPHDGSDWLGTGQTVELTATAGTWAGPVQDLGDGRYRRELVAPESPSEGRITLGWAGRLLQVQPKVQFGP